MHGHNTSDISYSKIISTCTSVSTVTNIRHYSNAI